MKHSVDGFQDNLRTLFFKVLLSFGVSVCGNPNLSKYNILSYCESDLHLKTISDKGKMQFGFWQIPNE